MNKENSFLVFVVEYYRNKKKLSGREIIALFDEHNIWDLAKKSYFLWHVESPENFVKEIDHFVSFQKILQ
jgi:hypothetical protein